MTAETVGLTAADGVALSGRCFPGAEGRATFVVAGATGVPQGFYRRFAEHASGRGHRVLSFDYRGIGASRRGPLRGDDATFIDWATLDLAAALDWALARGPTAVVGHSFGGHAFGMTPRANDTLGLYTLGTGSGWHGHMPGFERLKVALMWRVLGPIVTSVRGYLPGRALGLGEDVPLGVYTQWKRWCRYPRYFFDDPTFEYADRFHRVSVPIVALNADDDLWASPRARDAFFGGYTSADVERITLETTASARVGHMGYFRPAAARMWDAVVDWVERRALAA